MSIQVYGIPNCGTCKKAISWLENNNIEYEFINTKDNPPDQEAMQRVAEVPSVIATASRSDRKLGKSFRQ